MSASDEAVTEARRILDQEVVSDGDYETRSVNIDVSTLRSLLPAVEPSSNAGQLGPDVAMRRGRPRGAKLPYQEQLADTLIRSHFPDNRDAGYALVIPFAEREATIDEFELGSWRMRKWAKQNESDIIDPKAGHDYEPLEAEFFVELDRAVIADLQSGAIKPDDLLGQLRPAVIRIDSEGDVIVHVTTVERLDA